ncbi:MAG TPA: phage holin family protein [Mycobacteriales bacterium]|nr:phage holin family protein [Mycobacteriales bacterium]
MTSSSGDQSLGELVAAATRDLSLLVHKEVELAKTEITTELKRAGLGAGLLGGAGFVGFFALLLLSVAAAMGIATVIPVWGGFLCIGGLYALGAGLFALLGLGAVVKVRPPHRTIRTVKDDLEWAKHPTVAPEPQLEELRARHSS